MIWRIINNSITPASHQLLYITRHNVTDVSIGSQFTFTFCLQAFTKHIWKYTTQQYNDLDQASLFYYELVQKAHNKSSNSEKYKYKQTIMQDCKWMN